MQVTSTYESPDVISNETTVPATLTVTEADLFSTTDQKYLHKSQLTIFGNVTLGGVTSVTFNYYLGLNSSSTATPSWVWYPVSLYNTSTGEITQRSVIVDAGTYTSSSISYFADNVPLGAAFAFKVTGKAATGTPAFSIKVLARDN